METMPPEPINWGTFDVEPFDSYINRWPAALGHVPRDVIETWVYRHWGDFQAWLPLKPLCWQYYEKSMSNDEILSISHVSDWPKTLEYWGNDLIDGSMRKNTWLGRHMLKEGTTPAPIIVAQNASRFMHPREHDERMVEPYQLIEGHLRLAYLQAMVKRIYPSTRERHRVVVAYIPHGR